MAERSMILQRLQDVGARVVADARALALAPERTTNTHGFTYANGERVVDPITGEEGVISAGTTVDSIARVARPFLD